MSYTALFEFILEDDISYIIKYETKGTNLSVGDVFDAWFLDFEYNNKTYYPIYAINCGEIYYRTRTEGRNGVFCKSMIISEKEEFERWYIFCTDNESKSIGDQKVNIQDFIEEIFISDKSGTYTTKGSEDMISIDITTGAMSDSFASYGSTVSPSMSFTMFSCDFTDAIISGAIKSDVIEGSVVYVYYRLIGHVDAVPFGQFVIKEKPHITEETVSFNAVGIMEAYMDIAEIDIKALNLYHYNELEEKYVRNNKNKNYHMDFIRYDSDLYFWEFLPQDFLRVTGCPLYIEDWSEVLSDITEYNLMHLMIPAVESVEKKEESWMIESIEYASRITWRELLSGIAVLLRGNVIEKNGAFYIKKMPKTPVDIFYRQVFDNDFYDNSSSFGYDLSCPSNISVKANNWWFYEQKRDPVAFGYYNGESTVVINDKKSEYSNASYYPVTIECPWILFETIDRQEKRTPFDMSSWLGFSKTGQVMKWSKLGEQRNTAFVYSQATVNMIGWHPAFSAGEMVVVEDYEGTKKYVYIGEMTLHYDGGISCEINSRCDVEGNAVSSGSGGSSSSYSSGTVANSSGGNMSLQLGVTIKDGVIDGSKITDSTITGSKIEDSTITGSLIDDSTITNSHIVDGTLDGSTKIANATIDFEKVDTSFIDDLTADDAYVKNFKADVANIDFLTADDAIIKNIQATAISADYIKANTAELGYMTADEADIKYANITFGNIDTANIDVGNIGLLFNEVGLIDRATIVDGHISGYLDAVQIRADSITSGTLDAGVIDVTNLNAANITVGTINGYQIAPGAIDMDNLAEAVTGEIDSANANAQSAVNKALEAFNNASSATETANTAKTTADGKNSVFYQTTAPSGTHKINDVWFDTDDSNRMYYWNGTEWTQKQFGTNAIENQSITNALIADATIQSAKIANLDAAKITTGTLSAARIGANTITANKMAIADFTNYATANENFPETNIPTSTFGGCSISGEYITKSVATNQYLMLCDYTPCNLKNGEQIYYEMSIKGAAKGNVAAAIWFYGGDKKYIGFYKGTNTEISTTETVINGTLVVQSSADLAPYFIVGIADYTSTRSQIYVREVKFIRKNSGNLIVDGAITTNKLDAGAVTTEKIQAGAVTASTIESGAITADKIAANAVTSDKLYVGNGGNLYATGYDTFDSIPNTLERISYFKSQAVTVSIDETTAYYGKKCLKIVSGNTGGYVYLGDASNGYGCIPVVAGKTYIASAWIKASQKTSVSLHVLGHILKRAENEEFTTRNFNIGTKWERMYMRYNAKSEYPYISIRVDNNTNGATLWVDAIQIETGTATQAPSEFSPAGMTVIDGGNILTNTITANSIDINNVFANNAVLTKIFAQDITATGTITGATLKGGEIEGAKIVAKNGTIGGFNITDKKIEKITSLSQVEESATMLSTKSIFGSDGNNEKEGACLHSYNKDLGTGTIKTGQWIEIVNGEILAGIYDVTQSHHSAELVINGQKGIVANKILADVISAEASSGDAFLTARRTDTGTKVSFGVGSGGTNHGVYSQKLKKWIVYGDASNVYLNGNADTATKAIQDGDGNNIANKFSSIESKFTFKKISKQGTGTVSTTGAFSGTDEIVVQLGGPAATNYSTFTWNVNPYTIGEGNGIYLVSGYQAGSAYGFARVRLGRTTAEIVNCIIGGTEYASNSTLDISYR